MIEFTQTYFRMVDGYHHPAGYSEYGRLEISNANDPDDRGEVFKTSHYKFYHQYRNFLDGKKILEIGCALGFFVEDMREFGLDVTGMDISEWAISQTSEHCYLGDARTDLVEIPDGGYDVIVGCRLLPCFSDAELVGFRQQVERIAPVSLFTVDDLESYGTLTGADVWYNVKPLQAWQDLFSGSIIESIADPKWRPF